VSASAKYDVCGVYSVCNDIRKLKSGACKAISFLKKNREKTESDMLGYLRKRFSIEASVTAATLAG
jgi:hypothetical protein